MIVCFSQKKLEDGFADIILEPEDGEKFLGNESIAISKATSKGEEFLSSDKGLWTGKKEILEKTIRKFEENKLTFRLEPYYVNALSKGGFCVYIFDENGNEISVGDVFINGVRKSPIVSGGYGLAGDSSLKTKDDSESALQNVTQITDEIKQKIKELKKTLTETDDALSMIEEDFTNKDYDNSEADYKNLTELSQTVKQKSSEIEQLLSSAGQILNNSKVVNDSSIYHQAKDKVDEIIKMVSELESWQNSTIDKTEKIHAKYVDFISFRPVKGVSVPCDNISSFDSSSSDARMQNNADLKIGNSESKSLQTQCKEEIHKENQKSQSKSKSPVLLILSGLILMAAIGGVAYYFVNQSSSNIGDEQTSNFTDDSGKSVEAAGAEAEKKAAEEAARAEAEKKAAEEAARAEAEKKAAEEAARAEAEKKAAEEAARAEAEKKAAEEAARAEAEKKAAEEAARAEAEKKAAEEAARAEAERKKAQGDIKKRVSEFLSSSRRNSETAMELADELEPTTTVEQDLVFKLYYFAAMRDNERGALKYAECLDPSKPEWGTVGKDAVEAWEHYGKSPDGSVMKQNMKNWVEAEAKKGNAQAKKWLKQLR
jgi:hypothetical protein